MAATAEEIDAYREADGRLQGDLELYCRVLVRIRGKDGKVVPFYWKRAQRELHERIEQQKELTGKVRVLVLKGRRMGISTYIAARFKHRTHWHSGHETFIMTHRDDATTTLFNMVKLMHQRMPEDYRLPTMKANAGELVFAGTDSIYRVATAGGQEVGRSMNNQSFHGSELAFWQNASSHFASAIETVPDARDTEVILESTANGIGGEFYRRWQQAEAGIGDYIAVFLPWFWDDDYRRQPPEDWTPPAKWAEMMELYGLDIDQLYWAYNRNIALGGDPEEPGFLFTQEYPCNAEEAFQTSSTNSLIKAPFVVRARNTTLEPSPREPLIFGVDIAATDGIPSPTASPAARQAAADQKGSGDSTRLISRQGRVMGEYNRVWREADTMIVAEALAVMIKDHRPDKVFIDKTGIGWNISDYLRREFPSIVQGVVFGANAAEEDKYKNKRAEMYGRMRDWIEDLPADIPDDDSFHRQLLAVTWKPDMRRRIQLEEKELIKKRLGFSPDLADAAALTFAQIVMPKPEPQTEWWREEQRRRRIDAMTR